MSINHSKEPHTDNPTVPEAGQAVADGTETVEKPCCCCAVGNKQAEIVQKPPSTSEPWVVGTLDTPLGVVPQASTDSDRRIIVAHGGYAGVLAGCGIGSIRAFMPWAIRPLESPVLVSANYKLSFDCLRSELTGFNAWMLVLDTRGVNVWCSAGKGTFGTNEIVGRVQGEPLGRDRLPPDACCPPAWRTRRCCPSGEEPLRISRGVRPRESLRPSGVSEQWDEGYTNDAGGRVPIV